jgi:hypothetical protein
MGLIPAAFAVDLLDLEPSTHPADEHVSTWLTDAGTRASTRDSRTVQRVADVASPGGERVRAAEVIAALSLATDLGIGVPLEYGLQSTLVAMRLGERLGVDSDTASQTFYSCLLFYVGCTADAEVAAETFGDDDALTRFALPARFGSRPEMVAGIMRALANSGSPAPVRVMQIARGMPRAAREFRGHVTAFCEVAQMLTDQLGLPASMQGLFAYLVERWDGKGLPGRARHEEIPLPVRIASVARDAAFQRLLGGAEFAARVVRKRAGGSFDPAVATPLADAAPELLALDAGTSAWEEVLACEPGPRLTLEDEAIDRALGAMGDFADLASPYLVGHSAGVAELATAAQQCRLEAADLARVRRGACTISGAWRSRSASGRRPRRSRQTTGSESGCMPTTASASSAAPRSWPRSHPWPASTMSGSTVRDTTAEPPSRRSRRRRGCSPPPTPITR